MENVYDAQRQVVGTKYGDGAQDIVYVRDAYGRIVSESNAVASAVCSLAASGTATNEAWTVGGDALEIVRSLDPQDRPDGLAVPSSGYSLRRAYADDGNVESISGALAVVEYVYTPDRLDAGYTLTLSNGVAFAHGLARDGFRRSLVTGVASSVDGAAVEDFDYSHDALGRPVMRNGDTFGYNARGEVVFATVGRNVEAHGYDGIGNSTIAAFNGATNACTANGLNQYASIVCASASPCGTTVEYDLDGNTTQCGDWTYTYDAANRLKTVSSNDVLLVTNFYDAKGRRVRKVTPESATTFFYDGWNLIEERVADANGTASAIHYYWGKDLSETLQAAGGVGGLLYLTVDGAVYVPFYDGNGNVVRYLDANGSTVAQYTYDAFGRTISQTGSFAHVFRHRFSTKYFDSETSLYYYGHRFYSPVLRRWLTRDPIEEDGGLNLYGFCGNNAVNRFDSLGQAHFEVRALKGAGRIWPYICFAGIIGVLPSLALDFGLADKMNIEILHEHLFYDDGTNVRYGEKGRFSEETRVGYRRNVQCHAASFKSGILAVHSARFSGSSSYRRAATDR